jgi:hypothetical protein
MAFKMPGLLKSPAFGVGAFTAINVRYDRMAENAEKYKEAARIRGQELFAEHKVTKSRLKVENEAKQYIAAQFTPALADYLDSTGSLGFTIGMDTKDFLEQVDAEAQKVLQAGGIPEDFAANENMYYGEQRFEEYGQSYDKVKNFMDTQNNVFGNSFGMLMEENTPDKMTKEQFGVTAREDIASLERKGLGATEIKPMDEKRVVSLVDLIAQWQTGTTKMGEDGISIVIDITDNLEKATSGVANTLALAHYRYNTDRTQTGAGQSAQEGFGVAKAVMSFAQGTEDATTAMADIADSIDYMNKHIKGIAANPQDWMFSTIQIVNLYLVSMERKGASRETIKEIRAMASQELGFPIYSTIGVVSKKGAGTQSEFYSGA